MLIPAWNAETSVPPGEVPTVQWGNAGWLEIPYLGVMVSAASAARG
jgi:hypothetical protein